MSTCLFCSTIRSSSSLISEPNCRWPTTTNLNTSRPVQFALRKQVNRNNSRGIARVFQEEGVGVLFPDESVSLREIDAGEGKDVDGEVGGGVAEAVEETEGALGLTKDSQPPPGRYVRKREEYAEEDRFESRFKLRNGKEVCSFDTFVLFLAKRGRCDTITFGIEESLKELAQLADTAGLIVCGYTSLSLKSFLPSDMAGSSEAGSIGSCLRFIYTGTEIRLDLVLPPRFQVILCIFHWGPNVCQYCLLVLVFVWSRIAAHHRKLPLIVALARMEYQLPRLTKMWTHLERQAGGRVKGMGEKQIEVDKRILRDQIVVLKKELETVRKHRKQYRNRRVSVPVPVVSLVGYTNAGKSTLLNRLTGAKVLAEDRLFATLDPTTRRVQMKNGKVFLLTDTVGFIQKLPTKLVAAFRATLEEISESSLLVHVVDISHPMAEQQIDAVDKVLSELDQHELYLCCYLLQVDKASDPLRIKFEAEEREDTVCISALSGDGLDEFCNAVQEKLKDSMVWVEALIPFDKGEILSTIHQVGMVERTEHSENGTLVRAFVPLRIARLLTPMRQLCVP
ncbi:hypothetical protein RHSIM_Rhsim06G0028500 [Rhododendron simsii]|uniref:Hflx-type G domain-containing protein n=1 Tax=Rhododendron simsii TaxID=118357 RepID=A0A834GW23_RHOSS|nr:hypothetical protein RHSIM_Rhsim06G0028500 [Rhododendron simsii]